MNTEQIQQPPLSQHSRPGNRFLVGLIGGGLLLACLAAAGGWLVHDWSTMRANQATVATAPLAAVAPDDGTPPPSAAVQAPAQPAPAKPAPVASNRPQPVTSPPQRDVGRARPVAVCERCGTVESVRSFQRKGEANGVGAVAGGVLGGVVGNQIGGGNGRTAMTVLGAIGGGFAGNEVEKRTRSETWYEVQVRMDDGHTRTITQKTAPVMGTRVVVEGTSLRSVSSADRPRSVHTTGAYSG